MPMKLDGSCQCGGVQFSVDSHTPVPYQLCACSICRKISGYVGCVNLGGISSSLKIKKGQDLIKKYHAIRRTPGKPDEQVSSERNFCSNCSTMLWLYDESWPDLIHPFASAIDSPLPEPEEMVCIMADSKPKWAKWPEGKNTVCNQYPESSLEAWHKSKGEFRE